MEKFIKNCLVSEGVIASGIFLSGFYDSSFWLFGVIFMGIIMAPIGSLISWFLYKWCRRAGKDVKLSVLSLKINLALILFAVIFVALVFSGGVTFLM